MVDLSAMMASIDSLYHRQKGNMSYVEFQQVVTSQGTKRAFFLSFQQHHFHAGRALVVELMMANTRLQSFDTVAQTAFVWLKRAS
jgi:hypothetical protein